MIEKFNFYDVYGVPDSWACIDWAVLGSPWAARSVACGDLGSAILTLVSAYILGHVIQITANGIIHPKIMDRFGKVRFPSRHFGRKRPRQHAGH